MDHKRVVRREGEQARERFCRHKILVDSFPSMTLIHRIKSWLLATMAILADMWRKLVSRAVLRSRMYFDSQYTSSGWVELLFNKVVSSVVMSFNSHIRSLFEQRQRWLMVSGL